MWHEDEKKEVERSLLAGGQPLEIVFQPTGTNSEIEQKLKQLFEQITALQVTGVKTMISQREGKFPIPALVINGRVNYAAVPSGPEFEPFLQVLASLRSSDVSSPVSQGIDTKLGPAELVTFVAPTCPHCPYAVRVVNDLVVKNAELESWIIDVQAFAELAEHFSVQSVPLTLIDRGISFVGEHDERAIIEALRSRNSPDFGRKLLRSFVENNRLPEAQRRWRSEIQPIDFLSLWKASDTSLRMGLMLLAETVLEQSKDALDDIVGGLKDLVRAEDAALRGDTADLFGQIGHRDAVQALLVLKQDENPDVREIAEEALEEIEQQNRP